MSFESIASTIEQWVADEAVHGASIAIAHNGELVASHQAGFAAPGRPVTAETMFALASVSKPLSAAALMSLADEQILTPHETVTSILPEFGHFPDPFDSEIQPHLETLRDDVTFGHLLCHVSGLPELLMTSRSNPLDLPTAEEQIDRMLEVPLRTAPGERLRYSNLGLGVVSRAIRETTGKSIHEVIQDRILGPLGLSGIQLTPGPEFDDRIALVDDPANVGTPAESYNTQWWRENGIPWGGYFGTPEAIVTFASSFLPGRTHVLSDSAITSMTTDQTGGVPGGVESMGAVWNPGAWGYGWEVRADKRKHWTGSRAAASTFCHFGQAGTLAWADPERDLVVAVFGNRTVRNLWPLRPQRWADLSDAICEEADAC